MTKSIRSSAVVLAVAERALNEGFDVHKTGIVSIGSPRWRGACVARPRMVRQHCAGSWTARAEARQKPSHLGMRLLSGGPAGRRPPHTAEDRLYHLFPPDPFWNHARQRWLYRPAQSRDYPPTILEGRDPGP